MKLLLLLLFLCWQAFAQPSISDIATSDLDYTSIRITYTTSPAAFTRILYGVASNNLAYATNSDGGFATFSDALNAGSDDFKFYNTAHAFQLTGLTSGTTWWYSIEARPTTGHDCVASPASCTVTTPASFTTAAETSTSRLPTPVSAWVPPYPDTTGYYTINVERSGVHGDCIASAEVSGTDGTTPWTVTAGMALQQIIDTVKYGVIIQGAKGLICDNRTFEDVRWADTLTYKPADPRASNIDDPNHKWIILRTNGSAGDFPPYGGRTDASFYPKMMRIRATKHRYLASGFGISDIPSEVPHHYWLENIAITPDPAGYNLGFSGDGPPWTNMMCIGCSSGAAFGKYIVMDRMYLLADSPYGTGQTGHCSYRGFYIGGSYLAIIGSHIVVDCPEGPGGAGNSYPGSMSTGIEVKEDSPGPLTIHNNHVEGYGMGFYIETQGALVVPTNISYRWNTHYWRRAALRPPADATYISLWDNLSRHFRQQWESKGARQVLIDGNYIDGTFAAQNEGPAFLITANTNGSAGVTGNRDYTITNNIIRRSANIINVASVRVGDPPPGGPDVASANRILIANNLAFDLGRAKYSKRDAGAGVWNGQISLGGGSDLVLRKNTLGWATNQDINGARMSSGTFFTGLGMQASTGLRVEDNIFHVNNSDAPATTGVYRQSNAVKGTHLPIPNVVANSTPKAAVDSMYGYLNGSGGVTADYFWRRNIVVGGTGAAFGNYTLDDLDQTEVNTLKSTYTMPGDGLDTWVPGASRAARAAAAGITDNNLLPSYRCTPTASHSCHAGMNLDQIYASHGIVSRIQVFPTSAGARFTYIAPDSRTCAIDTSVDQVNWTRTTDAGGVRRRSTLVSGLSADTDYFYRGPFCYRLQENSGPYDFYASHELTAGSFHTTISGTRAVTFRAKEFPSGATQIRITATPASTGNAAQATCASLTCSVTVDAQGAYSRLVEYLNVSSVVIRTSDLVQLP